MAAGLLFANLGGDSLWEDEGDTAILGRNILDHGLPVAWDGVTLTAPDYGQRLAFGFVMVAHPWLQYYAVAASFALFGDSPWAARLPFALGGLATVVVAYLMMERLLGNRRAGLAAAALVTASVQFVLFSRQARNYSLNALLTCLLIWQFHRLKSRRQSVGFAAVGIVLFHAHPIGLASVAALGLLTLVSRHFAPQRRWFWPAALGVGLYAAPWLALSRSGYAWNTNGLESAGQFLPRLLQFGIEWASVTPVIGLVVLSLVARVRREPGAVRATKSAAWINADERAFVTSIAVVLIGQAVVVALTHSRDDIWIVGLHHTPSLIPLTLMLTALFAVKVSRSSRTTLVCLVLLFAFTRLGQATPWAFWADPVVDRDRSRLVTFHVPRAPKDRILKTTQFHFIRSLAHPNPGAIDRISSFLRAHAAPSDIVVTNYAWEALYFHTRLPQGARIAKSMPIYSVVRERGLPEYVYGSAGVRWIVWRRAWPAYFAEQDCSEILRRISEAGLVPRLALSVPETLFENRENIHFRRFPGNRYIFPWHTDVPDALVYRVETYEEAIESYRRQPPQDLEGLTNLAVSLIGTGRHADALPYLHRAAAVDPGSSMAHRNLANLLLDLGRPVEAFPHAERAVALAPDDPGANDALGRALALHGRFAAAARSFEHALRAAPGFVEAREHLGQLRHLLSR